LIVIFAVPSTVVGVGLIGLWNRPGPAASVYTSPAIIVVGYLARFRHLGFKDDHEINAAEWIVYDALYAYCKEMVRRGMPDGEFES